MAKQISSLKNDLESYNRGCWFRDCDNEPTHATRDLHQVGVRIYDDPGTTVSTKTVWAPCGIWKYGCNGHPLKMASYYPTGILCPHGSTPKERGIPSPVMPLVGKTAIVLETDI